MRALSRVVWSEGMHLAQHHFQVQTTYFEHVAGGALTSLFYAPYGVLSVQLDDEALLNGSAALIAARGIMPDGLPFSFPEDVLPDPLPVGDLFSPTQSAHVLLLALPEEVPGRANCTLDASARSVVRYSAMERRYPDETTGGDERAVQLARKNFRLMLDSQPTDGLVTVPLGRVQRGGAGHFVYDPEFIGPCLRIAANRRLRELVARMVEMLDSRAGSVRAERVATGTDAAEYAPREITGFWLLHALNSAIPILRHALQTGSAHPEQIYTQLAQLAGALCTFSLTSHPRDLPAYDHDAPEAAFAALERHIRKHLEVIRPEDAIRVPLTQAEESFYTGPAADRRVFDPTARWFLGVRSSAAGADVVARVPKVVKVCSAKFIARLVQEAYPGMPLEHVAVPPPELGPRIGMHYFTIGRMKGCWDSIVDTGVIGLYVPGSVPDAELELKVVLERT